MKKVLRVLLAEDSEDDAALLMDCLRRGGYEPAFMRVETAEAMRKTLEQQPWDVVISDYNMPAFDAPEAIKVLRASQRDIPAIVVSGTVGEEVAIETLKLGAADYLLKDNLTRLVPAIERALIDADNRRQRRAAEHMKTLIMANSLDMICALDRAGRFVETSSAARNLLGYEPSDLIGRLLLDVLLPADQKKNEAKIEAIINGQETTNFESRCIRKDGSLVDVVWSAYWSTSDQLMIAVARDITERKQKEEMLRIREKALAEVSQGVLIADENRLITYANPSFTKITGYEESELLGKNCALLQGSKTDPETIKKIRVALSAHEPFEGEILNYRKNGEEFWNDLTIAPIRGGQGRPLQFIGIQRDVTTRRMAQQALQQSEENVRKERALLRALIDSIPDLIFFKNKDSVFLGCNKAFENHIGITEKDLVGKTDFDLVPVKTAQFYRRKDHDLLISGKPQRTEEWIPSSKGEGAHVETVKTPYYGPEGESLGLIGVSRDITERKRAEADLRAVADRLKLATESSHVGIWEMDTRTRKMEWDAQMRKLYGLPDDVGGDLVALAYSMVHPEDLARLDREFETAIRSQDKSLNTEFRIYRANDGNMRYIRAMATAMRNDAGDSHRMVGTNWDVTEERLREKNLAKALAQEKELVREAQAGNKAKSEFLAVMSHEVRTPMNGILGFAELLSHAAGLPTECRSYAKIIAQSGESLLRILDDILDFSRLESGRLQVERNQFSPRKLLQDIKALLASQAVDKQLGLDLKIADDVPELVEGDAGRLRQVLLNLAGNAIKFTEHGSVRISLEADPQVPRLFRFSVKDTGPGISPEQIERIFQPFTQADSSISRRYGGTGLGLTISRRLTELLGGKLTVRSELGLGAEFTVTMPFDTVGEAAVTGIAESEPMNAEFASKYPLRILLVEDDRVNLKLIQTLIRRLGYVPFAAQNGREAVDIYNTEHPDCLLMDLQMPEMDGIEATEKIREIEKNPDNKTEAFISAVTANIFPADRQRCFEAGMNDYINKPVKLPVLAEMLRRASRFKAECSS